MERKDKHGSVYLQENKMIVQIGFYYDADLIKRIIIKAP
jgi:hypothetical protein